MNKNQVIEKIRALDLPTEEYIIFSGSVLAVHRIRETDDIDIVASPKLFAKLKREKDWKLETRFSDNTQFLKGDKVDVASKLEGEGYPVTLEEVKRREDIIEDIPFMSLEDVIQFKQAYNQEKEKHKRDIELIKEYLASK